MGVGEGVGRGDDGGDASGDGDERMKVRALSTALKDVACRGGWYEGRGGCG